MILFSLKKLKKEITKVIYNNKRKDKLQFRIAKGDYFSMYKIGYSHICKNSSSYLFFNNVQTNKNGIYKISNCFINTFTSQRFVVKNNDFNNGSIYFNINNSLFFLKNFALIIDFYLDKKVFQFGNIPNFDIISFYQKIIQKMLKRKKRNTHKNNEKIFYITYSNNLKKNLIGNIIYNLNKKNFDEISYITIKILYEYLPKNVSVLYNNPYYYEDLIYIFTYKSIYYSFFFSSKNFYYLNLFLNIALRRTKVISVINDNKINKGIKLKSIFNNFYSEVDCENRFKFQNFINTPKNNYKEDNKNDIHNEISYFLLKNKIIYLNLDSKILFEFSKTLKTIISIFSFKNINKTNKEDKIINDIYVILEKYIELFKLYSYNIFLNSICNSNGSLRYRLLKNNIQDDDIYKKNNICLNDFYNCIYNFNNYFCRRILMGLYFNSNENRNDEIKWVNANPFIFSTFLYIKENDNFSSIKKEKLAIFNSYKNKKIELYYKDLIKLFLFIILNKSNMYLNNILIYCIISSFNFLTMFSGINLNIILDITNILFKYVYNKNSRLINIEYLQNPYIQNLSKKIIYNNIITFETEKCYFKVSHEKLIDYINTLYFLSEFQLIKDNLFLLILNQNRTEIIHKNSQIIPSYKDALNEELYYEYNYKNNNFKFKKYSKKMCENFMNNCLQEKNNLEYMDNNKSITKLTNIIKHEKLPYELFLKKFIKNTFISYNHIDNFTYKNFIDISQIIKKLSHPYLYLFTLIFIEFVKYKLIKDISNICFNFQINYLNSFKYNLFDLCKCNARNIKILNLFIKKERNIKERPKFNELQHFSCNKYKSSNDVCSHFSFICIFLQNVKSYMRVSSLNFFSFIISNFFVNKKKIINLCIYKIEETKKKNQIYTQLFLKNTVQLIYSFFYFNTYNQNIYHYFYLFLKLQFFKNIKDNEEFFNNSKKFTNMHINKKIFLFPHIFFSNWNIFINIALPSNKNERIISKEDYNRIYNFRKKKIEEFKKKENINIFEKNEYLNNEKIGMLFYMQFSYLLLPCLFLKIFENHFKSYILITTYLLHLLISCDFYINSLILYKQLYIGFTCLYFFCDNVKQKIYENEELNFHFFQKINIIYLKKIVDLLSYEHNDKDVCKSYKRSSILEDEIYYFLKKLPLSLRRNVKIHAYLIDFVLYNV